MPDSALPLCLLGLLALSSACYIQNCPRGGKRSFLDTSPRPCPSCGPSGRGRCFGPSICCAEELGCYIGTPESAPCQEENYLASPCETGGKACGMEEEGHCAVPGICCNEDSCALDSFCLDDDSNKRHNSLENMAQMGGDLLMRIMHLAKTQSPGAGRSQQF
ncbi:NEUV protein, partial [Polypterus senegalus]|uniref:Oxytocin-neurophysin 1-like n=3 Tax=Polypteridae TaxID=8289 RepID=A0A8C4XGP2_ERPCA